MKCNAILLLLLIAVMKLHKMMNVYTWQVGGMVVTGATMFATVAPAVIAASTAGAISTGIYGVCRSAAALVDRGKHKQSIGVKDAEARNCWLSIAGNALGVASGQAVRALSKMTQNGQVLCK
jgi:hypothetical protein